MTNGSGQRRKNTTQVLFSNLDHSNCFISRNSIASPVAPAYCLNSDATSCLISSKQIPNRFSYQCPIVTLLSRNIVAAAAVHPIFFSRDECFVSPEEGRLSFIKRESLIAVPNNANRC